MPRVFISYRREDSADVAGRIFDRLTKHLGADSVFKDVNSIRTGEDFRVAVADSIAGCHAVIVVIGPHWCAAAEKEGRRRLDSPTDFVRLEIEAALRGGHPVVPVLVNGA